MKVSVVIGNLQKYKDLNWSIWTYHSNLNLESNSSSAKMYPSSKSSSKVKSGIPLPKKDKIQSHTEHQETEENLPNSARAPPQSQPPSSHPLAAITNKKKAKKKNQVTESWADETVESQSQKTRNQSKTESMRRKEDMEKQLKEAEGQIEELSGLLEKREKWLEETKNAANGQIEELEERLMEQEGILADHGIDPVTGQKVPLSEEEKKQKQASKKITKKTVQAMREKLQDMNRQTENFLADIENTMQYLASLEDASERAGPFSEETQAMIDRIGGDEEAIKRVYDENAKSKKDPKEGEDDENDENDDANSEDGAEDNDRFFITDSAGAEAGEETKETEEKNAEDTGAGESGDG